MTKANENKEKLKKKMADKDTTNKLCIERMKTKREEARDGVVSLVEENS